MNEFELLDAQARSIRDNAKRLGLIWDLRPAEVQGVPTDPSQVSVLLDGDSAAIPAYSLIGALRSGQRVMCMEVPPAGLYIVGYVASSPAPTVRAGAVATTSGTLFTVSTGTETNISHLRMEGVAVSADSLYTFMGTVSLGNGGTAGDSWLFRWRETTSLTGTVVATFIHLPVVSGFTDEVVFDSSFIPGSTGQKDYYLSVQRIAGGGTITILGNTSSHARIVRQGALSGAAPEFVSR